MAPALDLLPAKMRSTEARIVLLTIGLQESGLAHRRQIGGPARGLLQFEEVGVRGVLTHQVSRGYAAEVCAARHVVAVPIQVYDMLDKDDILAVALGRLLLWTDPRPLPAAGDVEGAWDLYTRTWRPGRSNRGDWDAHYEMARTTVGGG
ncbi:MAG: hypothetical protein EPN31_05870 [Castellaniella sp.]|uniref:hypothetical protein n=1 Tax=Castellaniella sp. TaxID=1955812 RepID=UPI001205F73B|nr:hypothetical protein [Castellaniella sp.]TAN29757.1 MAG: hypothetical protein EPN31_05870 [Castellaniella sp.]